MKIDVGQIPGYAEMTPEEKLAALEAYEYDDGAGEIERYKKAASKANSEAAEWKRKHNALLSEDDKAKQEREEEMAALRARVEQMEAEKLISSHKARFLALGYDDALAADTAAAMVNGETEKVFANQKAFLESHDKAYKAQLMGNSPKLPAGNPGGNNEPDWAKMIADAQARGDFAAVAYYTRLNQTDNNSQ